MPNRSKSGGQTKSDLTGPPSWGLGRGITLSCKKRITTETRSRMNSLFQWGSVAVPYRRELMTHGTQNQQDASRLIKPLIHPKYTMTTGNWNVRTLYRSGNIAQVAREMKRRGIAVMGISETHWTGQGTTQLADGETMIGHILRKDRSDDCSVAMSWVPEGKRRRGRPKTTWRRTVEKERQKAGWKSWEEVQTPATNQEEWNSSVKALCAMRHKEDR